MTQEERYGVQLEIDFKKMSEEIVEEYNIEKHLQLHPREKPLLRES